jgi:hypothetical protein
LKARLLVPGAHEPAPGYVGAVPSGAFDGPENLTQLVADVQPLAALPHVSIAVMVSLNATPAVWDAGVGTVKAFSVPALTAKLPEVPVFAAGAVTDVAVSVVVWALNNLIAAVACPEALKLRLLLPAPHDPAAG